MFIFSIQIINNGKPCTRGTEEVTRGLLHQAATGARLVVRVVQVEVSQAQGGFQPPPPGERPLVARADAGPPEGTLVAVILQVADACQADPPHVEASEVAVGTHVPPLVGAAEPVLVFGDYQEMEELGVLASAPVIRAWEAEGVEAGQQTHGGLARDQHFHTEIGRGGQPVKAVRLQPHALAECGDGQKAKQYAGKHSFLHRQLY